MKTIAYIRVSDNKKQDSSTQRHAIANYAKDNGLLITEWREFHLSGSKTNTGSRGIDQLLLDLESQDKVLVSDVARLGRDNVHQVLNTITSITTKGAELHFCYSKTTITPDDTNDISKVFIAIGEAYAAVKFAEERSQKAKAACDRRKQSGLSNGRKKGAHIKSVLDDHAVFIIEQLDKGTPKTKILSMLEEKKGVKVARSRLYTWIEQRLGGRKIK